MPSRWRTSSFRYPDGESDTLSGHLAARVGKGEMVAFVGMSGAGKTTLLDLLPRFHDVTGGRLTVDGRDVREVTVASLRALMGIVTQETFLFHDSLAYNIAYGKAGATREEIERAARLAQAQDFIAALPAGYATPVGERGVKLSGGQRQRIAIARAFLKDPPILLLDEATSDLDAESEFLVQQALSELTKGRTVLVIAHRLVHRAQRGPGGGGARGSDRGGGAPRRAHGAGGRDLPPSGGAADAGLAPPGERPARARARAGGLPEAATGAAGRAREPGAGGRRTLLPLEGALGPLRGSAELLRHLVHELEHLVHELVQRVGHVLALVAVALALPAEQRHFLAEALELLLAGFQRGPEPLVLLDEGGNEPDEVLSVLDPLLTFARVSDQAIPSMLFAITSAPSVGEGAFPARDAPPIRRSRRP